MENELNATKMQRNGFGGEEGQEAIDAAYVIILTFIIFTMQSGFGLLESGNISVYCDSFSVFC